MKKNQQQRSRERTTRLKKKRRKRHFALENEEQKARKVAQENAEERRRIWGQHGIPSSRPNVARLPESVEMTRVEEELQQFLELHRQALPLSMPASEVRGMLSTSIVALAALGAAVSLTPPGVIDVGDSEVEDLLDQIEGLLSGKYRYS